MIVALAGAAVLASPTLAALTSDVGDTPKDHSTEWSGQPTKPSHNVYERAKVKASENNTLQLGGKLLSEVMSDRTLRKPKLPVGNVGAASKPVDGPNYVAMSKVGYAGVQFEGSIGTKMQTKNYIGRISMNAAPSGQLERVIGYTPNNFYGCFNIANNFMVNNISGNEDATVIWGVSWSMFNADTWTPWGSANPGQANAMVMYDTAYDPTTYNLVYGWMGKLPASNDNIGWYKLDMAIPSFTLISQPQIEVRGVACSDKGQYYAIAADGKLYKVAKETGIFTEVGNTGARSEFRTTAAYDELSGNIFYVTVNEEGSSLYRIDPTTATGTKVYDFPQLIQLTNLYFGPRQAVDGAPNMPENVTLNFAPGSLKGAVEFDAPTVNYDDEKADGRLAYTISFTWTTDPLTGDEETKEYTGSASYGSHVAEYITLPEARRYTVKVRCSNEIGDGPWAQTITKWLGPDAPDTPYSFQAAYEGGKWKLTWDAHSSTGVNGGDIDPNSVKYILTFMPEGRQVITEGGATSYEEEMPEPKEFGKYYWTCQAMTDQAKASSIRESARFGLGTVYPYWSEDFTSYTFSTQKDALTGFQVLELAENSGEWSWNYPHWINHGFWRGVDSDSYLVLPKVYLYGGRYYTFNFVAGKMGETFGDPEIRVLLGRSPDEAGLNEKVLMDRTALTKVADNNTNGEAYSLSFMPEHDGVYYLAIHHCNKDKGATGTAGLYNLRIGGLEIMAPIIPGAPEQVQNLEALADVDGNNSVTVSFTCPRENMGGTALMSMTRAEIKRGDLMVADVPLTGSTFKWIDSAPDMGTNTYTVTPYNNEGAGNPSTVSCYVGLSVPADVAELIAVETETKGTVKLSWTPVDKDVNGKNLTDVEYVIVRNTGDESVIIAKELSGTGYIDVVTDGEQTPAIYGIIAMSSMGMSENITASQTLLIGSPYPTPYIESIANGYSSTLLMAEVSSDDGRWELFFDTDFSDLESVDQDNGFIGFYSNLIGTQGALTTGRIAIPRELENPVLSFYYYLMPQGENTIQALISTDDSPEYELLSTFKAGSSDGPGWQVCAMDMTPYLGKTIRIRLVATTISHTYTLLDRLALYSMANVDINNVTVSAPEKSALNEEIEVTVGYMNAASKPAKGYKVSLLRDGDKIAEVDGDEIGICERGKVTFKDVIPQTAGDVVKYEAKVEISGDENMGDNISRYPADVAITKPELPVATGLTADKLSETEVDLKWSAPDMNTRPRETVTEGFEGHTTGDTEINGWLNIDRDGRAIGFGGSSNIEFPGLVANESPAPWLAVNTTENNCDPAHGGDVFMGACYLIDSSTNDDWLISPELSGHAQTISVWTRSYTNYYGGDRIEILYSDGSRDPKDFVSADTYTYVPVEWTEMKVELPEGAKYFAIRCTSIYQIMLCVDDVTYSPKGASFVAMNLLGYNIWRNGKKINETLVTEPAFKDIVPNNSDSFSYQVTAVYDLGESGASNKVNVGKSSSVSNIDQDNAMVYVSDDAIVVKNAGDCAVSVNHIDGRVVYKDHGDARIEVAPAIYVVTVGSKAVKVIVR